MKKILVSVVTIFAFLSNITLAHALDFSIEQELKTLGAGSEFVSGKGKGGILMKVNLWGAVGKPGVHHIPNKTDILTLLTYAGGPRSNAVLDDVVLKRTFGGKTKVFEFDIEEMVKSEDKSIIPVLQPGDIILVKEKSNTTGDIAVILGIVSSILSIVLVGFVLADKVANNN